MGTPGDHGPECGQERRAFRQFALRGAESVHVLRLVEQREAEAGDLPALPLILGGATDQGDSSHGGSMPGLGSRNPGRGAAER